MARVVLESHVARGWFVHMDAATGALELRPSRDGACVLTFRQWHPDVATATSASDFIAEEESGRFLVAQAAPGDSSVQQLSMEHGAGRTRMRVLSAAASPSAGPAAAAPGTKGAPWQTGESPFAIELLGGAEGYFLGNVPVSATAHAVVAVCATKGGTPLLLCATPVGGSAAPDLGTGLEELGGWEAVDAPAVQAGGKITAAVGAAAAGALSAFSAAFAGLTRAASAPRQDAAAAAGPAVTSSASAPAAPRPAAPMAPPPRPAHVPAHPSAAGRGVPSRRWQHAGTASGTESVPRREGPIAAAVRRAVVSAYASHRYGVTAVPRPPSDPTGTGLALDLGPSTRSSFAANGYVVLPDVVPRPAVDAALRAINSGLGSQTAGPGLFGAEAAGGAGSEGGGGGGAGERFNAPPGRTGFAHSITMHPDVMALLWRTQAWGAASTVLGAGASDAPAAAQVALRFPQPPGVEAVWGSRQGPASSWHIDGMDERKFAPFSLLVGVLLSDTCHDDMGQLIVYPGSHRAIARSLSLRGDAWVAPGGEKLASRPALDGCEPLQVRARAGSVVLAHPLLAHTVGINYSPHVRYCAYFRVSRRDHDTKRFSLPESPMALFPGAGHA